MDDAGTTKKLSAAQIKLLGQLESGERFCNARTDILNRTANILDAKGLAIWVSAHYFGGTWRITDAGRAAISSAQGGKS